TLVVNDASNLVYAAAGTSLHAIDGVTGTRLTTITLPASATSGAIDTRLAIHKGTGHVYVRVNEFPNSSRLVVIDGNRASPTFNTILTTLALGREDGTTMVVVDEAANRVITTSRSDLKTSVIDALSNSIVGTVPATQTRTRIAADTAHHRAYVIGGPGYIQAIDAVTGTHQAYVPVGAEIIPAPVDTATHTVLIPENLTTTVIPFVNETGLAGLATPLPHGDGRLFVAARNGSTGRIYVANIPATAAGGSDGLPGARSV